MSTEEQVLESIRRYVRDSQDEKHRSDPTAVIELCKDRATSLATLEKQFDTFTGQDRYWLYMLAYLLLEGDEARSRFYAARLPLEHDPVCRVVVARFVKGAK